MASSHKMQLVVGMSSKAAEAGFKNIGNSAVKNLANAALGIDKVTAKMRQMGTALVASAAVGGAGLYGLASQASDLNESANAAFKVFGEDGAGYLQDFARSADTNMAMSERAFNEASVAVGALLTNMGYSQGESARMSVALTGLASDMASIFNTSTEDAIHAIGAAFRGETEPIRRYGVQINDVAMKNYILESTGKKVTGTLTQQQKAMATYGLLIEQTAEMQGDFNDTSDSLANVQKIVAAQFENLSASVGQGVVPMFEALFGVVSDVLGVFNAIPAPVKAFIGTVAGLATAITGLSGVLMLVAAHMLQTRGAMWAVSAVADKLPGRFAKMGKAASRAGITMNRAFFAITAAFIAYGKVMEAINKKDDVRKERTRELTQAFELQRPILDQLALAAHDAGDEFDYVARNMEMYSQLLASTGDGGEKLTQSLGELGLQTSDVTDIFAQMTENSRAYFEQVLIGNGFTEEQAEKMAWLVDTSDEVSSKSAELMMDTIGLTDAQKEQVRALEELDDQYENTDIQAFARSQVNAATATSETEAELVKEAKAIAETRGVLNDSTEVWKLYLQLKADNIDALEGEADAEEEVAEAVAKHEAALKEQEEALDAQIEAIEDHIDALEDEAEAQEDAMEAQMAAADALYALREAQWDVTDAVTESMEVHGDAESTARDKEEADIALAQAAQDVADAEVRVANETATAAGEQRTAAQNVDDMNRSLLGQASVLNGPQRAALLRHIALVNGVPTNVMTEINAMLDAGDIAGAETLLAETSRAREAAINAVANTYWAEQALNYAARNRQASIRMKAVGAAPGSPYFGATGAIVTKPTLAVVGEDGPEAVTPLDQAPGASPLPKGKKGSGTGNVTNNYYTNNFPAGAIPREVVRAQDRYSRIQGPL